ncbi:MAG: hypothetical protein EBX50_22720 [Chitinophagia bacterium]|nr:hypothetical protein [Chitinophagia bacterium]
MVGASFTAVTLIWNVSGDGDAVPSLTARVIVVLPEAFATGVKVTLQIVDPFDELTSVLLIPDAWITEDVPEVTVKDVEQLRGVSTSEMVTGTVIGVSSAVV